MSECVRACTAAVPCSCPSALTAASHTARSKHSGLQPAQTLADHYDSVQYHCSSCFCRRFVLRKTHLRCVVCAVQASVSGLGLGQFCANHQGYPGVCVPWVWSAACTTAAAGPIIRGRPGDTYGLGSGSLVMESA
jgi:hypothetical protein